MSLSLSISSCSCLHPEPKKETVVSWWHLWFLFFIEGSNLVWEKKSGERERGEARAPQERHACLCVVPFCMFFNLSHSVFVMCKGFCPSNLEFSLTKKNQIPWNGFVFNSFGFSWIYLLVASLLNRALLSLLVLKKIKMKTLLRK